MPCVKFLQSVPANIEISRSVSCNLSKVVSTSRSSRCLKRYHTFQTNSLTLDPHLPHAGWHPDCSYVDTHNFPRQASLLWLVRVGHCSCCFLLQATSFIPALRDSSMKANKIWLSYSFLDTTAPLPLFSVSLSDSASVFVSVQSPEMLTTSPLRWPLIPSLT